MGRTVTVNAADAASSSSGFKPYPKGDYIGRIIDVKRVKFAKTGGNANMDALNIQVKFTESGTGEGVGKKFTAFRVPDEPKFASGSSAFLFYQFYKALGVVFPKAGEGDAELPDYDDLLGEEIGITLGLDDSNKPDPENPGKFLPQNVVSAFFPASRGVVVSAEAGADDTGEDFDLGA